MSPTRMQGFRGEANVSQRNGKTSYDKLQEEAKVRGDENGLVADGVILEGDEVESIVNSITSWHADLLAIGRRHPS